MYRHNGEIVLNPQTIIHLGKGSYLEMDTVQIKGVDSTIRTTVADVADDVDKTNVNEIQ